MLVVGIVVWAVYLLLYGKSRRIKCSGQEEKGLSAAFYRMSLYVLSRLPRRRYDRRAVTQKLSLLYPIYEREVLSRHYYAKKLSMALAVLFVGVQFVCLLSLSDKAGSILHDGNLLDRGGYGEDSREIALHVSADGREEELTYSLESRKYEETQIREQMTQFEREIEQYILGENASLEEVTVPLALKERYGEFPFSVEWESEDYTLVDSDGSIGNEELQEPVTVGLTAVLSYGEVETMCSFFVRVCPRPKTDRERRQQEIADAIQMADQSQKTQAQLKLPQSIGEQAVTYALGDEKSYLLYLLGVAAITVILYYAQDRDLEKKAGGRKRELMLKYPEFVSQFVLLTGAGMTVRSVLIQLSKEPAMGAFLQQELMLLARDLGNGVLEADALDSFGKRCGAAPYIKLCGLLIQNMKKGNSELLELLQGEAREAFVRRKNDARKLGEEAGTKLLLPMGGMLFVVLILIVVPAFLSFQI